MNKEDEILISRTKEFIQTQSFVKRTSDFIPLFILDHVKADLERFSDVRLYRFNELSDYFVLVSPPEYDTTDNSPDIILLKGKAFSDSVVFEHRKILGTIMSLGISREKFGDIFITDRAFYVYASGKFEKFLLDNLTRIGSELVQLTKRENLNTAFKPRYKENTVVTSSTRLDAVVSKVFSLSRNDSRELVEKGQIKVNGVYVYKPDCNIFINDVISVRKYGKFKIYGLEGYSRKGNEVLQVRIYY